MLRASRFCSAVAVTAALALSSLADAAIAYRYGDHVHYLYLMPATRRVCHAICGADYQDPAQVDSDKCHDGRSVPVEAIDGYLTDLRQRQSVISDRTFQVMRRFLLEPQVTDALLLKSDDSWGLLSLHEVFDRAPAQGTAACNSAVAPVGGAGQGGGVQGVQIP